LSESLNNLLNNKINVLLVLFLYDLVWFLIIWMLLCAGTYKIKMILLKVFW
jgi:hypothetical protein